MSELRVNRIQSQSGLPIEMPTSLVYTPAGAGAVATNVQSKLREFVSVKDFGAVGDGVTDDIAAIDRAIAASRSVYFPPGVYSISRPIVIRREKMVLRGAGMHGPWGGTEPTGGFGSTTIRVTAGFASATVGNSTGRAAIWYQAPGDWNAWGWIEGGCFEDFTIDCHGQGVEGIRFSRVCNGHIFKNLRIHGASIGIFGMFLGWLNSYHNVFVTNASIVGIRLNQAHNGCTFVGCGLYGGDIRTQVLLDVQFASYGNSWVGGFIEGGQVGVRLVEAQVSFHGTDFEVLSEKFIAVSGVPESGPFERANPPITVTGCTFVGSPSLVGIEVNGGAAEIHGNFFITFDPVLPGVFCMHGITGADATVVGFEQLCISEHDNTTRGWPTDRLSTGVVFSRFKRIATEGVTFPSTPVVPATPTTLSRYEFQSFAPTLDGPSWGTGLTAAGNFTRVGNKVDFVISISGPAKSTVATTNSILGLPGTARVGGVANVVTSFNTSRGSTYIGNSASGVVVYMPAIASTTEDIIVSGTYYVT